MHHDQRYWVIGGNYRDLDFNALRDGSETILGPFECEQDAKSEWKRVSFEHKSTATTRFLIVAENGHGAAR
jgi:hypothetical protein